jgi:hypothetical protein
MNNLITQKIINDSIEVDIKNGRYFCIHPEFQTTFDMQLKAGIKEPVLSAWDFYQGKIISFAILDVFMFSLKNWFIKNDHLREGLARSFYAVNGSQVYLSELIELYKLEPEIQNLSYEAGCKGGLATAIGIISWKIKNKPYDDVIFDLVQNKKNGVSRLGFVREYVQKIKSPRAYELMSDLFNDSELQYALSRNCMKKYWAQNNPAIYNKIFDKGLNRTYKRILQ